MGPVRERTRNFEKSVGFYHKSTAASGLKFAVTVDADD
jgi:hypothetical protein